MALSDTNLAVAPIEDQLAASQAQIADLEAQLATERALAHRASMVRAQARQLPRQMRVVIHPDDIPLAQQTPQGRALLAASAVSYDTSLIEHPDEPGIMPGKPASDSFTGLKVAAGVVSQEYNARILRLSDRLQVWEEMRRSCAPVAAIELLTTIPLSQTDWYFEGGDDAGLTGFLNWNLHEGMSLPISETAREAALATLYGFNWCYPTYEPKRIGNKTYVGWDQFEPRCRATTHQWRFHDNGRFKGLIQYGNHPVTQIPEYVSYDAEEILKFTWRGDGGDPEGLGAFRQAFRSYSEWDAAKLFAMMRLERVACPIPVGVCKEGFAYNDEDAAIVFGMLSNLRTGRTNAATIPDGWEIITLDLGTADVPFGEHIERLSDEIKETMLVNFVGADASGGIGKKDASAIFFMLLESIADWFCDNFNIQAVPPICAMNGYTGLKRPVLKHTQVAVKDPEKYAMAIEKVTRHPETMTQGVLEVAHEQLGLPAPDPNAVAMQQARLDALQAGKVAQESGGGRPSGE